MIQSLAMSSRRPKKAVSSAPVPAASRRFSSAVVDGAARAAGRAMLHAVGFTRAARAIASRCSTALVEPPRAMTTVMAVSYTHLTLPTNREV